MNKTKYKQFTLRIPEDLHQKWKIACIQDGRTMNAAMEALIRDYLYIKLKTERSPLHQEALRKKAQASSD
jgi:hypothetical protein